MNYTNYDAILNAPEVQEIGIPADTLTMLLRYFEAAANLYGRIPIRKLMEIFTEQTGLSVPDEQLIELMNWINPADKCLYSFWTKDEYYDEDACASDPMERDLLVEFLTMFEDDYETFQISQQGIPYAVLPQKDFLKYEDENYFEFTPACGEMVHFLMETQEIERPDAMDFMDDMMMAARQEDDEKIVVDDVVRMGARFDKPQLATFAELYRNVVMSTRIGKYCGHTPTELPNYQAPLMPNIDKLYTHYFTKTREYDEIQGHRRLEESFIPIPKHQPGTPSKNGPCPCGSGKKYKRCCGKGK